MPADARPGAPGASTLPDPVRRSPRQIAPSIMRADEERRPAPALDALREEPVGQVDAVREVGALSGLRSAGGRRDGEECEHAHKRYETRHPLPVVVRRTCSRHRGPPRVRRIGGIVVLERRGAHRAKRLIFRPGPTYLRSLKCVRPCRSGLWAARYWPEWRLARATCSSDAHASSRSSSAFSRQHAPGRARPSSSLGTQASARPGLPPSSRAARATPGSRCSSVARSILSAPSCRTSRSSRPSARSAILGRSTLHHTARSCGYSRRRSRCSPSAPPPPR